MAAYILTGSLPLPARWRLHFALCPGLRPFAFTTISLLRDRGSLEQLAPDLQSVNSISVTVHRALTTRAIILEDEAHKLSSTLVAVRPAQLLPLM
jgi:hypothetical protein